MESRLKDDVEYRCTQEKLRWLEERYAEVKADVNRDAKLRELSMRSYARWIKQLREEVISYRVVVLGLPGVSAIRSGLAEK